MTTALFANIERSLLANLNKTTTSVKVAVAWFTNPSIFRCLYKLACNGKRIELILSDDIINFSNEKNDFQLLINIGVEVKISRFPNLMHHKFCIIDERVLMTGSYNWTLGAEKRNYENVIISNELNLINQFNKEFNNLTNSTERLLTIDKSYFNSYLSEKEKNLEIQLLTQPSNANDTLEFKENAAINDEADNEKIELILDKAELLYLQMKHQPAIDTCQNLIDTFPKMNDELLSSAFSIIASAKWRQRKHREQISFATKAIEIDNRNYDAYNLLGIGYSEINNSQKSIENYQICISAEPEGYIYYKNRAMSYFELKNSASVPKNLKLQFEVKANHDLHKIIELTNKLESNDDSYRLYLCRGEAYLHLDKCIQAKSDLLKAKDIYEKYTEKSKQDKHEYRDIISHLKEVDRVF